MSLTVAPYRAPDYTFRWPVPTRTLSQAGDAYGFQHALHTPNLSQVITNYTVASGTPVLDPPRAETNINEALEIDLPYLAQPLGPFFPTGWPALYFSRLLIRAEIFTLGSADARDGFGICLTDGSVVPFSLAPSSATGLGGLWVRRPNGALQWAVERYNAAGALTGSDTFQVNPAGELAAVELDVRAGNLATEPTVRVRGAGSGEQLLDVGTYTFGADMPSFLQSAWFLCLLQVAAGSPVTTRGAAFTWFPQP